VKKRSKKRKKRKKEEGLSRDAKESNIKSKELKKSDNKK
jgi:hypothetical protein